MNSVNYPLVQAYWQLASHADLAIALLLFVVWMVLDFYVDVRRRLSRWLRFYRDAIMALFFGWLIFSVILYFTMGK